MIDKNRLEQKCSMWNIALTGEQLDQLDAFAQILVDYNQKVNLTAITDPEGIEDKHFKRFHLRGLKKVEIEFGLLAIAHNLAKVAS